MLREFPNEIEHIWCRCGTAEVATDPMGIEETDCFIALKPRSQWKKATSQQELKELIKAEVDDLPGQNTKCSQPIEQRVNEMTSGVKGDIAIKLYGKDFDELTRLSHDIERVLKSIRPGAKAEVSVEQLIGAPTLEIELNLKEMARYKLSARTVFDYVEALGSKPAGDILKQQYRFPLIIRLTEKWREKSEIAKIPIATPDGGVVTLGEVTTIRQREGPAVVSREWGQRRTVIECNIDDPDIAGFVAEAQQRIAKEVNMPKEGGYRLEWGGTYEHLHTTTLRLAIVIPIAVLLIFILLYFTFWNFRDVCRVFLGVPFAVVGGIIALQLRDLPFSVSAAVGFIALSGVSVLNSMLLVTFIKQTLEKGVPLNERCKSRSASVCAPC